MSVSSEKRTLFITRGEKAVFDIFLEKKDGLPRPVDLTNFDKFSASLALESGGYLQISEVANAAGSVINKVSPDVLGQINVTIGAADTQLLLARLSQDLDIEWDNASVANPRRKRITNILSVEDSTLV